MKRLVPIIAVLFAATALAPNPVAAASSPLSCVRALVAKTPVDAREAREAAVETQRVFWQAHGVARRAWWRRAFRSLRDRLQARFMSWNVNYEPAAYIDDGTYGKAALYAMEDPARKAATDEARDDIMGILGAYASYRKVVDGLIAEAFTHQLRRHLLKAEEEKAAPFPRSVEMPQLKGDGSLVYKPLLLEDPLRLSVLIRAEKVYLRGILGGWWRGGRLREALRAQALRRRQLEVVRNRLRAELAKWRIEFDDPDEEGARTLGRIEKALADPALAPWAVAAEGQRWAELRAERKDLFNTIEDQSVVRAGKTVYGALTDAERTTLGLGNANSYVRIFRASRIGALVLPLFAASSFSVFTVIDYFRGREARIEACAESATEAAYVSCSRDLFKGEFGAEYVLYMEERTERPLPDPAQPRHGEYEDLADDLRRARALVEVRRAREARFFEGMAEDIAVPGDAGADGAVDAGRAAR